MKYIQSMAASQLFNHHPIKGESYWVRDSYLRILNECLRSSNYLRSLYVRRSMQLYIDTLLPDYQNSTKKSSTQHSKDAACYFNLLPFDIIHILGYDKTNIMDDKIDIAVQYLKDHAGVSDLFFRTVLSSCMGEQNKQDMLKASQMIHKYYEYIDLFYQNLNFIRRKPCTILVSATMSAGKSTFINALVGKEVNRSQNMACTSKIHTILSKMLSDDFIYEYDHDLVLEADNDDLMKDNQKNKSDEIIVSCFFDSQIGGERIIIRDTPGVNSNRYPEHRLLTEKWTASGKYDLHIVLLDAAQLHTNDMMEHLIFVRTHQTNKNTIFVLNRIDVLNTKEDNLEETILNLKKALREIGFLSSVMRKICFLHSRFVKS